MTRPGSSLIPASLAALLLFSLALLPRAQRLDQYVHVDEDLTIGRTGNFAEALADGRWHRTYQTFHPEVTSMWVALAMLQPNWAREFAGSVTFDGRVHRTRDVVSRSGFMEALVRVRQGAVVLHSLLLVIAALLLWRLAGPWVGVLAGALLALEPFLVAHGQFLHMDELMAELMAVSALAGLVFWVGRGSVGYLLLGAVAGGLAVLSKTPSLYLVPYSLLAALLSARAGRLGWRSALGGWLAYAGLMALTCWALWPAMWLTPIETIEQAISFGRQVGSEPDPWGSFFLGQRVEDAGPAYYPVAVAYRLGPGMALGLILLALAWRRAPAESRALGLLMITYVVGFTAMMLLGPKKADRYLLPIFPALGALAGLGWWSGARWLGPRLRRAIPAAAILGAAAVGLQAGGLQLAYPYYLAYYNPLLGGGAAASRVVEVGWGEGLDVIARALNARPDGPSRTVAVPYPAAFGAHFGGRTVPLTEYDVADYAVLYVATDQRNLNPPPLQAALMKQEPELEVHLNGIRYAQLYGLPRPEFAGGIVLDAIDLSERTVARRERMGLMARWAVQAGSAEGLRSRVALLAPDGSVVAQSSGPLHAGPLLPGQILEERHPLQAPERLGRYTVAISLEAGSSGQALPLIRRPPGLDASPTRLVFHSLWVRVQ